MNWFTSNVCNEVTNGLDLSACFEAIALNGVALLAALAALFICWLSATRRKSAVLVPADESAAQTLPAKFEWSVAGCAYVAAAVGIYCAPWLALGFETRFVPSATPIDALIAAILQSLLGATLVWATQLAIFERAPSEVVASNRAPPPPVVAAWLVALLSLAMQIHTVALSVMAGVDPTQASIADVFGRFFGSAKLLGVCVQAALIITNIALCLAPRCGGGVALVRPQDISVAADDDATRLTASPELRRGPIAVFSVLTFSWLGELLKIGYRRALTVGDLYRLHPSDTYDFTLQTIETRWCVARKALTGWRSAQLESAAAAGGRRSSGEGLCTRLRGMYRCGRASADTTTAAPSGPKEPLYLWNVMQRSFGAPYVVAGVLKLIYDSLKFVSPVILNRMIQFLLPESTEPLYMGFVYVGSLALSNFTMTLVLHQYFHRCYRVGMRLKIAVNAMVFNKALVVKMAPAPAQTSSGAAANDDAADADADADADTDAKEKEKATKAEAAASQSQDGGSGRVTNLMSVDAQKLQDLMTYLHMIWSGPFQIIGSLVLLWQQLGPSVIVGVVVMIGLIPFSVAVGMCISKIQTKLMKVKDRRQKDTNEMLSGMKIVKQYAWESGFEARINTTRAKEMRLLFGYSMVNAVSNLTWSLSPIIVCLLTFATYLALGNTLTASKAFTSMALFDILRFPVVMFPRMIANLMEALVSVRRVQSFLMEPEVVSSVGTSAGHDEQEGGALEGDGGDGEADEAVTVRDATFFWTRPSDEDEAAFVAGAATRGADTLTDALLPNAHAAGGSSAASPSALWNDSPLLLRNVTFSAPRGQLTVIAGKTGSGKSGLLGALLGDVPTASGTVTVRGSVAYCAQVPWIQHASLRSNVLFESAWDETRYAEVIAACALTDDIALLPNGDATEIGEKGVNLSGGQKQRVALARALYNEADVYLLDDCLSAVDPEVAQHLFRNVILEQLVAKGKTTILVTHNTHAIEDADFAVFLGSDQRVAYAGPKPFPAHLLRESVGFEVQQQSTTAKVATVAASAAEGTSRSKLSAADAAPAAETTKPSLTRSMSVGGKKSAPPPPPPGLTAKEGVAVGAVSSKVYWMYCQANGGPIVALLVIIGLVGYNACQVAANRFLAFWSDATHAQNANVVTSLEIYSALLLGAVLCSAIALAVASCGSIRAAMMLHSSLLRGIVRAPLAFFHATPIGRLQNRFSKDLYTIDEKLVMSIYSYLSCLVQVAATLGVIAYVTPYFTVVLLPMGLVYLAIQRFYIPSSRELQRLNSVLRSPMFSHFAETLDGADTIRAFSVSKEGKRVSVETTFRQKNQEFVDGNSRAYYLSIAANRWLAVRLEMLGTIAISCSALFAVFMRGNIVAGLGGMAISYALRVTQTLNWMVRMSSQTETNIVSVERVVEYASVASESDWVAPNDSRLAMTRAIDGNLPAWNHTGALRIANLGMRYRPGLPLVLKGIDIDIPAGSSVGIVGRTGAGKSSLFAAILRLVEPEAGSVVEIDGVDVASLGLHTLRRAISIIPQDPVLFNGSLRFNLDPLEMARDDGALWAALGKAGLGAHARGLPGQLDHAVLEGGKNFSQGEKQLVCLARALLRSSKLLLLDEATSSVDFETDAQIQATIRNEFGDATVLCIAHRVDTIRDCDQILVLSDGKVAEFGPPEELQARGGDYARLIEAHDAGFTDVADALLG